MHKLYFVASECVPFAKTGGLADVVGSLPRYFQKEYFDCRVVLPKYSSIPDAYVQEMQYLTHFYMDLNWRDQYVGVFTLQRDGITYYFLDNEEHFSGDGLYRGMPWDLERFAFFSKAALSILPILDFHPDVIHCHDWQAGLVPVYLHERFQGNPFFHGIRSVMTIHNLKFQGLWDLDTVRNITGLSSYYFTSDKLEFNRDASYLKGGLVFSDEITTVSRTYAEEIKTAFFGEGLDGLLRARAGDLRGIVNGIDYEVYNPAKDPCLLHSYDVHTFRKEKQKNKAAMQADLHLDEDPKIMMIGIVSRLTDQKGFDLIAYMMEELCQDPIQLVVLGNGDPKYENMFRHFAWKYDHKVSAHMVYDDALAHRIYGSCDAFLMPSLFEPCGLSQLMSLRYGTLPIVRETGGLKDTVEPYNEYENTGTGFSFANYNAHEMLGTIRYAEHIYREKRREWNKMVERAMTQDFSWTASARQYQELYDWLIG